MSSLRIRHLMMATLLATLILVFPALAPGAAADCGPFPTHRLWGNLNAEKVTAYVHRKFRGDWGPYVRHLEKQVKSIEGIREAGKAARLRIGGETVTLSGAALADYAEASAERLAVVRCLATRPAALKGKPVRGAGRPVTGSESFSLSRSAQAAPAPVALNISTSCRNGETVFTTENRGGDWPASGQFQIYRIGTDAQVVSSRRMRLKKGQKASFKVAASKSPTGQLGLFVKPSWYERPFAYDATATCR